jgi:hypothetical protein
VGVCEEARQGEEKKMMKRVMTQKRVMMRSRRLK